jgi:hypothetical protein
MVEALSDHEIKSLSWSPSADEIRNVQDFCVTFLQGTVRSNILTTSNKMDADSPGLCHNDRNSDQRQVRNKHELMTSNLNFARRHGSSACSGQDSPWNIPHAAIGRDQKSCRFVALDFQNGEYEKEQDRFYSVKIVCERAVACETEESAKDHFHFSCVLNVSDHCRRSR